MSVASALGKCSYCARPAVAVCGVLVGGWVRVKPGMLKRGDWVHLGVMTPDRRYRRGVVDHFEYPNVPPTAELLGVWVAWEGGDTVLIPVASGPAPEGKIQTGVTSFWRWDAALPCGRLCCDNCHADRIGRIVCCQHWSFAG